jgi:hypothetical protein
MADIHVIFPPGASKLSNGEAIGVSRGKTWAGKQELIHWHLDVQDPKINRVCIEFDDTTLEYFPSEPQKHKIEKLGNPGSGPWEGTIWGTVPTASGKTNTNKRHDKYWIRGYSASSQNAVAELDPDIITDDP